MTTTREILSITPTVRPASTGWLAVSPRGSCLAIGVVGPSEGAARGDFAAALAAWAALHDQPEPKESELGA